MTVSTNWAIHEHPAWRERANFIINARVYRAWDSPEQWGWEQLWKISSGQKRSGI